MPTLAMIQANETMSLAQAVHAYLPHGRRGRPLHVSTVYRWVHDGVVGPLGTRVKLRAFRLGGVTYTTRQWCDDFLAALNADQQQDGDTEADVARRGREASQALEALGA